MPTEDQGDEPLGLTPDESARIDALYEQRIAKFREIVAHLARHFGYGDVSGLPAETREALEDAVNEACDDWRVAIASPSRHTPKEAAHQILLRNYHDLGDKILEVQDAALRRAFNAGPGLEEAWRSGPRAPAAR